MVPSITVGASYVGETGKSMEAVGLVRALKDGWRNIAIALTIRVRTGIILSSFGAAEFIELAMSRTPHSETVPLLKRQTETNRESRAISLRLAVTFAGSTVKTHFGLFARVLLTLLGAWVALEIVVITGQRFGILLWLIAHLSFLIFFAGVELGVLQVCLAFCEGKEPTFADAFKYLELGPKFLAGQVLYILLVAIGLPLLIFPGVYAGVRCSLFGFCMAAGEVDLIRSFKQSAILTGGATMRLFWILMALLSLNVLGTALLGIGLFITLPLSILTLTAVYQQLSRAS